MEHIKNVSFRDVDITDGFWAVKQEINRKETVFAVEDRFEETGRFEAFKFNWKEGSDIPKPHFFWDSDVAKWLEGAAYILAKNQDDVLESKIEEVIDDIEKNQDECGYFNIYHTIVEPELRFKNRDHHELYCLGHLIEAAIAYFNATGKDRFLKLMEKYVDYVIKVFCVDKTSGFLTPGHEEIELALFKFYELTKDDKYLKLADFFIENRHKDSVPEGFWSNDKYFQSDKPVKVQREAQGHAVRACYLYSGLADYAKFNNDEEMLDTCKALFDDIVNKKMYITGGVGSSHYGEAFTVPFDLPNDTAYAETCASIALTYFADRMKNIDINAKYGDIVEKELYNGGISGVSLDGRSFFYENPLEINLCDRNRHPSVNNSNERLPITQRVDMFGCSCCPPNLIRYFASVGDYIYSYDDERIFVNQYISSSALFNGGEVTLETNYPNDGKVKVSVAGMNGKKLYMRIPGWCKKFTAGADYKMHNGFAVFCVNKDIFTFELDFVIEPCFYKANSLVRADGGKVALCYGPVVYCIEGTDNNIPLSDIAVDINRIPEAEYSEDFGLPVLLATGYSSETSFNDNLYLPADEIKYKEISVKFIPFYAFANRGETDMRVWVNAK